MSTSISVSRNSIVRQRKPRRRRSRCKRMRAAAGERPAIIGWFASCSNGRSSYGGCHTQRLAHIFGCLMARGACAPISSPRAGRLRSWPGRRSRRGPWTAGARTARARHAVAWLPSPQLREVSGRGAVGAIDQPDHGARRTTAHIFYIIPNTPPFMNLFSFMRRGAPWLPWRGEERTLSIMA
jgi:hypothetical protein